MSKYRRDFQKLPGSLLFPKCLKSGDTRRRFRTDGVGSISRIWRCSSIGRSERMLALGWVVIVLSRLVGNENEKLLCPWLVGMMPMQTELVNRLDR
jgi:hypothetical protein